MLNIIICCFEQKWQIVYSWKSRSSYRISQSFTENSRMLWSRLKKGIVIIIMCGKGIWDTLIPHLFETTSKMPAIIMDIIYNCTFERHKMQQNNRFISTFVLYHRDCITNSDIVGATVFIMITLTFRSIQLQLLGLTY